MTRILCLGEAIAEIRRDGDSFAVDFAGEPFNTSVYCGRRLRPCARRWQAEME